ncbi:MAG: hypothetical protein RBS36_11615 [Thiomicrospira sp.]|jgi:hypothetical protein|nr:hypothetical protein [Thiomicrospira sp.]MDY0137808.1 hypothetical protein [Thiomicrospira sp.]
MLCHFNFGVRPENPAQEIGLARVVGSARYFALVIDAGGIAYKKTVSFVEGVHWLNRQNINQSNLYVKQIQL